jgi:hypothetical protein
LVSLKHVVAVTSMPPPVNEYQTPLVVVPPFSEHNKQEETSSKPSSKFERGKNGPASTIITSELSRQLKEPAQNGAEVGWGVGAGVGAGVGFMVGLDEGVLLGDVIGLEDGVELGDELGLEVGD